MNKLKKNDPISFHIITIFPKILDSYFSESLFKRALKNNLLKINFYNLRDFTNDVHRTVDDKPYGGGGGMVLKPEPILKCLISIKKKIKRSSKSLVISFDLRGKSYNQKMAHDFGNYDDIIFICGRYEGIDERVKKFMADITLTIGPYILAGGELPAAILVESIMRLKSGFLGKYESLEEIKGSYPVYTRPENLTINNKACRVTKVLIEGNHKEINKWRGIIE